MGYPLLRKLWRLAERYGDLCNMEVQTMSGPLLFAGQQMEQQEITGGALSND